MKNTMIPSIRGLLKAAMESALGENPPHDMVVKVWVRPSYTPIPAASSAMNCIAERTTYTIHNILAVSLSLGLSLSSVGPGASALNNCRPATANLGRTAKNSMMIPMPPSHCIKQRQNSKAFEWDSISVIMVAPVAVMPDMDSNRASTGCNPLIRKGKALNIAADSHAKATIPKLSRFLNSSLLRLVYCSTSPTDVVTRNEYIKIITDGNWAGSCRE
ncbi:MAG: hypothetical protein C5S43_04610 [Candidatus Methanocomedens sp.]|nr:MAG: hypothetical protein C5S43_04610 [ANME-2 cluster archaeon]